MDSFFLFLRLIAYTIGIANLAVLSITNRTHYNRSVALTLQLMYPLTVILVGETALMYFYIHSVSVNFYYAGSLLIHVGMCWLIYILPLFSIRMQRWSVSRAYYICMGCVVAIAFGSGVAAMVYEIPWFIADVSYFLLITAIVSAVVLGLYPRSKELMQKADETTRIAVRNAKAMFLFLPLLIVFDFYPEVIPLIDNLVPRSMSVLPALYLYWNGALLWTFLSMERRPESPLDGSFTGNDTQIFATTNNLSPREEQVLQELLRGQSYAQIADVLCISIATVKTHVNRIYKKSGYKSRSELMAHLL